MLDTSILLTATDEGHAGHERALDVINGWPAQGTTLYTSGQIIREYLFLRRTRRWLTGSRNCSKRLRAAASRYMTQMWLPQCSYMSRRGSHPEYR